MHDLMYVLDRLLDYESDLHIERHSSEYPIVASGAVKGKVGGCFRRPSSTFACVAAARRPTRTARRTTEPNAPSGWSAGARSFCKAPAPALRSQGITFPCSRNVRAASPEACARTVTARTFLLVRICPSRAWIRWFVPNNGGACVKTRRRWFVQASRPAAAKFFSRRVVEAKSGALQLRRDSRRAVRLTDAGHAFLARARQTLQSVTEAREHARLAARGEGGELWFAGCKLHSSAALSA